MEKALSQITREEWIGIRWIETDEMGQDDRMFVPNGFRTPDEAAQAREEWDTTALERAVCVGMESGE
jgi:hypothetical protein